MADRMNFSQSLLPQCSYSFLHCLNPSFPLYHLDFIDSLIASAEAQETCNLSLMVVKAHWIAARERSEPRNPRALFLKVIALFSLWSPIHTTHPINQTLQDAIKSALNVHPKGHIRRSHLISIALIVSFCAHFAATGSILNISDNPELSGLLDSYTQEIDRTEQYASDLFYAFPQEGRSLYAFELAEDLMLLSQPEPMDTTEKEEPIGWWGWIKKSLSGFVPVLR